MTRRRHYGVGQINVQKPQGSKRFRPLHGRGGFLVLNVFVLVTIARYIQYYDDEVRTSPIHRYYVRPKRFVSKRVFIGRARMSDDSHHSFSRRIILL